MITNIIQMYNSKSNKNFIYKTIVFFIREKIQQNYHNIVIQEYKKIKGYWLQRNKYVGEINENINLINI